MQKHKLVEVDGTCWYMIGRDSERSEFVIDTNEYIITRKNDAILLDPGGTEIFPHVVRAIGEIIDITRINKFFGSHQDPDILSSLPLWMGLCPNAEIYLPNIWTGFISHFGHEYVHRFVKIPDHGFSIPFGDPSGSLSVIPAHYVHASGNYSIYDPICKVLFSGDIGAALLPSNKQDIIVNDFASHVQYMEGFHRRWMPSNRAKNKWVEKVRTLDIDFMCPQHGAIFQGEDVQRFLDWFYELEVGSAI